MRTKFRDLREDKDITQTTIAEYLHCDQSDYSKYERGIHAMPLEFAIKLALYYNTSVDYLVGLTDEFTPYKRSKKL